MAAGYSGTPLWKKLVIRPADRLTLIDGPRGWAVADVPDGVVTRAERGRAQDAAQTEGEAADTIIVFLRELATARRRIPELAPRIFPDGAVWAAWPRRAGGHQSDITENDIRAIALPLGLVDVKVAALDVDWSGLRLVWRRERRQPSKSTRG